MCHRQLWRAQLQQNLKEGPTYKFERGRDPLGGFFFLAHGVPASGARVFPLKIGSIRRFQFRR